MATITFRTDSAIEQALAELMADGADRSTVIREAILLARRARFEERLRAQAEACRDDPEDRAEMRRVMKDMDAISAW